MRGNELAFLVLPSLGMNRHQKQDRRQIQQIEIKGRLCILGVIRAIPAIHRHQIHCIQQSAVNGKHIRRDIRVRDQRRQRQQQRGIHQRLAFANELAITWHSTPHFETAAKVILLIPDAQIQEMRHLPDIQQQKRVPTEWISQRVQQHLLAAMVIMRSSDTNLRRQCAHNRSKLGVIWSDAFQRSVHQVVHEQSGQANHRRGGTAIHAQSRHSTR
mmetsp:Transcript_20028/g.31813  ORF Transcript_20028/g.31813 Transcript_20028/m.31813 type:complete len:215 (+) Transcript_20028:267-911(+)